MPYIKGIKSNKQAIVKQTTKDPESSKNITVIKGRTKNSPRASKVQLHHTALKKTSQASLKGFLQKAQGLKGFSAFQKKPANAAKSGIRT